MIASTRKQPVANQRRATVLIVVLVIVTLISLAAYGFTSSMQAEHIATRYGGDRAVMRQAALSGKEIVSAILEQPREMRFGLSEIANKSIELWPVDDGSESIATISILFPGMSTDLASESTLIPTESSKINLHQLLLWDQQEPGYAQQVLMQLPGMDQTAADRMLDWMDSDSEERIESGEQGARNSIPIVVDELASLQQTTDGIGSQNETADSTDQQTLPAWLNNFTVHSAQRNETSQGYPRINVNATDLQLLHQTLTEQLSIEIANHIIAIRQFGPHRAQGSSDVSNDASSAAQITIDFSQPARFNIGNLAQILRPVSITITQPSGSSERSFANSPVNLQFGVAGLRVDEIFDSLTTRSERRVFGQIDIATASAEVIAAVPGIDMEIAQQIVSSRDSLASSSLHPIGILSSIGMSLTTLERALPHVCVGGAVVRVQLSGSVSESAPSYRCEMILDASRGDGTRQAFFRTLTSLLPASTIGTLDQNTRPDATANPNFDTPSSGTK